jgi:death-on-curing protein
MTDEPHWVSLADLVAIHDRQLAEHGGGEGLRDQGLLESALARPRFTWQYAEPPADLATLAAALAFGIITNHPFVDGNNRTGYVACRLFLLINGSDIVAVPDEKYLTFYAIAAGELTETGLADWIRRH